MSPAQAPVLVVVAPAGRAGDVDPGHVGICVPCDHDFIDGHGDTNVRFCGRGAANPVLAEDDGPDVVCVETVTHGGESRHGRRVRVAPGLSELKPVCVKVCQRYPDVLPASERRNLVGSGAHVIPQRHLENLPLVVIDHGRVAAHGGGHVHPVLPQLDREIIEELLVRDVGGIDADVEAQVVVSRPILYGTIDAVVGQCRFRRPGIHRDVVVIVIFVGHRDKVDLEVLNLVLDAKRPAGAEGSESALTDKPSGATAAAVIRVLGDLEGRDAAIGILGKPAEGQREGLKVFGGQRVGEQVVFWGSRLAIVELSQDIATVGVGSAIVLKVGDETGIGARVLRPRQQDESQGASTHDHRPDQPVPGTPHGLYLPQVPSTFSH